MSIPAEDEILSIPAAQLARRSPDEWAEFKAAFKAYAAKQRDLLVQASLLELQKSQGRAQEARHLVSLFDDAVQAADRISERAGKVNLKRGV